MIQESLSRLIKNKTVIIIAHRMRTVADADKIVVLKDGVVAESGTPEELKKKDGIYANMMKTQLMAADWSLWIAERPVGTEKKLLFHVSTGLFCFIFYELVVKY